VRASGTERDGDGTADPAAATGNERTLATEVDRTGCDLLQHSGGRAAPGAFTKC
jgi:hypothetical protein